MARRSIAARILAPLALLAAGGATYGVVKDGLKDTNDKASTTTVTSKTTTSKAKSTSGSKSRRTYTVKSGDVLSAIAEKTGVALERIEELNPDIDPSSLQKGQKLKLPPK